MRNRIVFFIIFVWTGSSAFLNAALPNETTAVNSNDTIRINSILNNARQVVFSYPDSTYALALQAEKLSDELGYSRGLARAKHLMGTSALVKGEYPNALGYYSQALMFMRETGDSAGVSDLYANIGIIYSQMGDYRSGLNYFIRSLEIDRQSGDIRLIASDYNNIGNTYMNSDSLEAALKCYFKAYAYCRDMTDSSLLYSVLGNISNIYLMQEIFDSALYYAERSVMISWKAKNLNDLAVGLNNYGLIYYKMGQYPNALMYYDSALAVMEHIHATGRQAGTLKNIANVWLKLGQPVRAIETGLQAYVQAVKGEMSEDKAEIAKVLSEAYEANGEPLQALKYYKLERKISDSLNHREREAELSQLMIRHEVNEKQWEIRNLEEKNRIYFSRNLMLIILLVSLLVLLILLLWRNHKLVKAHRLLVEKQQDLVERGVMIGKSRRPRTGLCNHEAGTELISRLQTVLESEKAYLDPGLSLDILAARLNTNKNVLSGLINNHFSRNFNTLINEYRVNEVLRLFAENAHENLTLEAIASDAGFSNRVTFYNAFKKVTGVSPSFYLGQIHR
ncbi:MAG: tetratricopeptide repeat protein [Bacteroidetes bacterium]|nr:tetratricopeptide repeat protein [Bacteroidota bacterium]